MGSKLYLCALEVMAYVCLSAVQLISYMFLYRAKVSGNTLGTSRFWQEWEAIYWQTEAPTKPLAAC